MTESNKSIRNDMVKKIDYLLYLSRFEYQSGREPTREERETIAIATGLQPGVNR